MPIRQDDNQPNRRFGIVNIILIGVGALLLFSSLFPNQNMQIPRVPYSLFIDQVNDGEVKRAYITQEQIRYELNGAEEGAPSVLATTPIFDMDLPQRLESKGVEFAAAPPKKPNFFSTILSWVVPPIIFILVLQFFARRSMGGGGAQGALSFTKSKAKVYVPDDESKITFDDVAGVDEAKDELTEIVDFLKKPEKNNLYKFFENVTFKSFYILIIRSFPILPHVLGSYIIASSKIKKKVILINTFFGSFFYYVFLYLIIR